METVAEYVRICPTCGAENHPEVMRCACGALLAGVDVVRKVDVAHDVVPADVVVPQDHVVPAEAGTQGLSDEGARSPNDTGSRLSPGRQVNCPYPDCAQTNPPGAQTCAYCNRPLSPGPRLTAQSLLNLPAVLAARFRVARTLPAKGAEAELLVVQPHAGGPERVAKIYRQGIEPSRDVLARIERVDSRHRVRVIEAGFADGHAYELMEFCAAGSLRELMQRGPLAGGMLVAMIRELAAAIGGVHAAGLVHRDLKPENVLVRSIDPLELVLTDFSIASVLEGTQRFTSVARTLPYASPESLSGVIDGKSDYWALGMVILEAATGAHPFAALSEAVILHQLTTRNIDLAGIADRNLRKLLRGLLLRDPALRWGAGEVARWLAGDPSLAEPVEHGPAAGYAEPYRLGDIACATSGQLAVALATHWKEGIADLGNSQLLAWFRDVQKDHNVVRLLIENRQERKLHPDVQLLKLILFLAPGIPPVFRGESVALPAILAHASQALEGSAEAAQWLHALYQHRVLDAYAEAGNQAMKDVLARWSVAGDAFDRHWKDALQLIRSKAPKRGPDEAVDWDAARYGKLDPTPPPIASLHARLLAIAYDAGWAERLRRRLTAELATLRVHAPWLADLGDPVQMDATSLLVAEALLPEARRVVDRQKKAELRRRNDEAEQTRALARDLDEVLASIHASAQRSVPTDALCDDLLRDLQRYFDIVGAVRGSGRTDPDWIALRNAVVRSEPAARRMQRVAERLRERLAVSGGWLNLRTALPIFIVLLLTPRLGMRIVIPLVVAIALGVIAWQLVPNFLMLREIRALAPKLTGRRETGVEDR